MKKVYDVLFINEISFVLTKICNITKYNRIDIDNVSYGNYQRIQKNQSIKISEIVLFEKECRLISIMTHFIILENIFLDSDDL